jgi:hypothetical protein
MKKALRTAIALGMVSALAGLGLFRSHPAGATDAPAPSASASASVPTAPPTVRGADIPQEPSKEPKPEEWKTARRVRAHRSSWEDCELLLVREWLRVACKEGTGATLVAGDPEGVKMFVLLGPPAVVGVTTPLRRGKSQLFSLLDFVFDYDSSSLGEGGAISILWREGQEDPVIAIDRRPE